MCPWGKERLAVFSGPPAFGVLHCVLRKNLLSQLDMESQWFTTSPFFRLTSPEHSVFRKQNMWLPLKAVVTTFCAGGECSKNPHLLKRKGSSQEGPAGIGEGRWEQPQLSWRVMLLAWDGLGTSGEPCLRFVVPHWRQVSITRHSGLWRQHRGHLQMCGERSPQIPRWRGKARRASPHLFAVGPQSRVLS